MGRKKNQCFQVRDPDGSVRLVERKTACEWNKVLKTKKQKNGNVKNNNSNPDPDVKRYMEILGYNYGALRSNREDNSDGRQLVFPWFCDQCD